MKVLLAGATGAIGAELASQLKAAGHDVLGLTRSTSGAERLAANGIRPVLADLMDVDGLLRALDGVRADAAIHQATAITGMPLFHRSLYATDDLREQGTANLLRAAAETGAARVITQSFFLGYGYRDHGTEPVTEDRPFAETTGHRGIDRHMRSMRANEEQVLGSGGIALRYGMFYGPEPMTRKLFALVERRRLPVVRGGGTIAPIHLHDAASAAVAALERGQAGQAYNIADDQPVGFDDYIRAMAEIAGAPAPRVVPGAMLAAFPYLHALTVATSIRLSTAKAKRDLAWVPAYPSIREGLLASR
jgi:nucleoside-diphosphate-sugar epimerase